MESPALRLTANGAATDVAADLSAAVRLQDLAALSPDVSGPLAVDLTGTGNPAAPSVDATIESAEISLPGATRCKHSGGLRTTAIELIVRNIDELEAVPVLLRQLEGTAFKITITSAGAVPA